MKSTNEEGIKIDVKNKNGFDKRQWIKFVNSLSGAKSANLIGTVSKNGNTNLSIVSSVFHLGANPPLMGFVLRPHSEKSPRHTLLNLKESNEFTVNHVNSDIFKKAHQTSARYGRSESEFTMCGLTEEFKDGFKSPYVLESNLQIGLSLEEILLVSQNSTYIIIGEIKFVYLSKSYIRPDGSINLFLAQSVAVTGLDEYHSLHPLARLSYAKPGKEVEEI